MDTSFSEPATKQLIAALRKWIPLRSTTAMQSPTTDTPGVSAVVTPLENNANPNIIIDGQSALHRALSIGSPDIVRALLAQGVDTSPGPHQPEHPMALVAKALGSAVYYRSPDSVAAHTAILDALADHGVSCHVDGSWYALAGDTSGYPEVLLNPLTALVVYSKDKFNDVDLDTIEKLVHWGANPASALARLQKNPVPGPAYDALEAYAAQWNAGEMVEAIERSLAQSGAERAAPRFNKM